MNEIKMGDLVRHKRRDGKLGYAIAGNSMETEMSNGETWASFELLHPEENSSSSWYWEKDLTLVTESFAHKSIEWVDKS